MMKLMMKVMSMSYGTMVYSIYLYDMKECRTHVYVSYIDDDDDGDDNDKYEDDDDDDKYDDDKYGDDDKYDDDKYDDDA
jgi:hypothetical protein